MGERSERKREVVVRYEKEVREKEEWRDVKKRVREGKVVAGCEKLVKKVKKLKWKRGDGEN